MRGKIFALSMVIVFFSLFGFGIVSASLHLSDMNMAAETCMGEKCSPLGHIISHVYIVSVVVVVIILLTTEQLLTQKFRHYKKITLLLECPPPNTTLRG